MLNIEDNFHPVEKYYCTVWYSNFGSPFIRTFIIKVSLDEDLNEKTVRQKICDLIDETEDDEYLKNATKPGVTDTIVAWSKIR